MREELKEYVVVVEGVIARSIDVKATSLPQAMSQAKAVFKKALTSDNGTVVGWKFNGKGH